MNGSIPFEAVQEAIHIAYLAGKNSLGKPVLSWIPPSSGTEDRKGSWFVTYTNTGSASEGE